MWMFFFPHLIATFSFHYNNAKNPLPTSLLSPAQSSCVKFDLTAEAQPADCWHCLGMISFLFFFLSIVQLATRPPESSLGQRPLTARQKRNPHTKGILILIEWCFWKSQPRCFLGLIGQKYLEGELHQLLTGESIVADLVLLMKMEWNTHIKGNKPETASRGKDFERPSGTWVILEPFSRISL